MGSRWRRATRHSPSVQARVPRLPRRAGAPAFSRRCERPMLGAHRGLVAGHRRAHIVCVTIAIRGRLLRLRPSVGGSGNSRSGAIDQALRSARRGRARAQLRQAAAPRGHGPERACGSQARGRSADRRPRPTYPRVPLRLHGHSPCRQGGKVVSGDSRGARAGEARPRRGGKTRRPVGVGVEPHVQAAREGAAQAARARRHAPVVAAARLRPRPIFSHAHRRTSSVGPSLRLALEWWLEILQLDLGQEREWEQRRQDRAIILSDARGWPPRAAEVVLAAGVLH